MKVYTLFALRRTGIRQEPVRAWKKYDFGIFQFKNNANKI